MSSRRRLVLSASAATILAVAASLFAALAAGACCCAVPLGTSAQIADQEILIVWDPATKTEHFIRRASFSTSIASFGFLVPTPTVPTLAEAPDALFSRLAEAIKPKVVDETRMRLGSWFFHKVSFLFKGSVKSLDSGSVRVVLEQRVAGYDAVVLDADDPEGLAKWLQEHGYDSRPALVEWLRPYVALKWKLTAFKLAAKGDSVGPAMGETRYAVRMSFQTEKPLFPFRTPSDNQGTDPAQGGGSLLRIFFVGPEKVAGSFGGTSWNAHVPYADKRDDLAGLIFSGVPKGSAPTSGWLTVFEDHRWPRAAGDDLYFSADSDPNPILPAPIVHAQIQIVPIEGIVAVALVVALPVWWRRRRRPVAT